LDHETTPSAEREGHRVIPQQIHIFDSSRKARLEIRLARINLAQRRSCLETRGRRFQKSVRRHRAQTVTT
jgi:hypothetical protein